MRRDRWVRLRRNAVALGLLALAMISIGVWGLTDYWQRTHSGALRPAGTETITQSRSLSERDPGRVDDRYEVPADQPRQIQVPAIRVEGYIQKVGIDSDGSMATPNNIYFAGWYVNSVRPGEKGVSILNGHVRGRYSQGIFQRLSSLRRGDMIRIQMGDLSWREFRVIRTESLPLDMAADEIFKVADPGAKTLRLITCDGTFDATTLTYSKRFIIDAVK